MLSQLGPSSFLLAPDGLRVNREMPQRSVSKWSGSCHKRENPFRGSAGLSARHMVRQGAMKSSTLQEGPEPQHHGRGRRRAQRAVVYVLILVLVISVVVLILLATGNQIANLFINIVAALK